MNCLESSTGVSNVLTRAEVGRGERIVIQNEAQVCRPALQNALVPTTPTERRKAFKEVALLSSQMESQR